MGIDLDAIRARCDAATPGPWSPGSRGSLGPGGMGWDIDGVESGIRGAFDRPEDAEFVARARDDVPALLEEVDRLTAIVARELERFDHEPAVERLLTGHDRGDQ